MSQHPFVDIGERLRVLREHLGYRTRKEFAEVHGFNYSRYQNWESGYRRMPLDEAIILEERYGMSLDFIYCGRLRTLPHNLAVLFASKPADK